MPFYKYTNKSGGISAMKIKGRLSHFYFALLSICTIFASKTDQTTQKTWKNRNNFFTK